MRNYKTLLILLATCSVVLAPLCLELFGPASYARWLIAQAANDYQNGSPEAAKESLKRAVESSQLIAGDPEYWKLRFQVVFDKKQNDVQEVSALFEDSKNLPASLAPEERVNMASIVAELFKTNKKLPMAIAVLETNFPPIESRSAEANNELAYFRSLAKTDLELALREIDAALDRRVEIGFLDTKAWVLHGLKQDKQAIKWAQESVDRFYESIRSLLGKGKSAQLFYDLFEPDTAKKKPAEEPSGEDEEKTEPDKTLQPDPLIEEPPAESDKEKTTVEIEVEVENPLDRIKKQFPMVDRVAIDQLARNIAVMRFHRACILDELNRTEESEIDYRWLDRFGFSATQELD